MHLVLEVRGLKAGLAAVRNGAQSSDSAERLGPYDAAVPEVTVVIPLYNYADFIGEAIASVARSDHSAFEVIVIDDGSTDDSAAVAREALAAAPWVPARLVRRSSNAGLAAARNLGLEIARGQYVFMLDADNAVYPHALSRLASALDVEPAAAFAYGILESFDVRGPRGLMSWVGWDPFWLRYDNPIDAMAMLRRDAVVAVGGYTSEPALYGWEDFALWCALAQTGREGTLVPEILGRYRVARHSMISTTNIDATSGWAALERRYPAVFSPLS
jgi:glycosyltransferase involved in cell wall biosynthesis